MRYAFWLQGLAADHRDAYECIAAFSATDFRDGLKKFDISTLVIHGDDDQVVPFSVGGRPSAAFIDARYSRCTRVCRTASPTPTSSSSAATSWSSSTPDRRTARAERREGMPTSLASTGLDRPLRSRKIRMCSPVHFPARLSSTSSPRGRGGVGTRTSVRPPGQPGVLVAGRAVSGGSTATSCRDDARGDRGPG